MLPDTDLNADIQKALLVCRQTGVEIIGLLEESSKKSKFPIGTVITASPEAEYHCVTRGCIYYGQSETVHRVYENGDIFLLSNQFDNEGNEFHTDFAATTTSFSEAQLFQYQEANPVFQKTVKLVESFQPNRVPNFTFL